MFKKLIYTLALLVMAGLSYGIYHFSPVLTAGSGFAAKNICSGYFLSGLPGQQIVDEALIPAAPSLSKISFDIDLAKQQVDTSIFGIFKRRAVFTEGTGCTLLSPGQKQLLRNLKPAAHIQSDGRLGWPQGSAAPPQNLMLEPALARAFTEPDALHKRNTKAIVVIHNGRLVAERYAAGITADTPLIGWSMTKSVTNLLLGILVKDGRLSLDQHAPVPAWHLDNRDPRSAITIDQLLRMSSGLVFEEDYGLYSDVTRMLSIKPDAAGFAASKPLWKDPGSFWAYSSGTSNILSGIIRRTLGDDFQNYYDFTQQRLFLPLGIQTATLETDNNGTFIGSSFMYASARDWARLGQFCLQNGQWNGQQLLPKGWIEYSTTPTPTHPRNNYGAHFWLNADPETGHGERTWPGLPADTYSMNGFQGQRVLVIPSKDMVVVRLGFSGGRKRGVEELTSALIEILAPD